MTGLNDLPEDTLLAICDYVHPDSLLYLSYVSSYWNTFCTETVWPRRIAAALGVRAIRFDVSRVRPCSPPTGLHRQPSPCITPTSSAWRRIFTTFATYPSARILCICVQIGPKDSVASLAIQYAVSTHDIFRTNSLFTEHQLASRTHLYVPLLTETSVRAFTGLSTPQHAPFLVRDKALSRKYFLVVKFRPSPDIPAELTDPPLRAESYVRQLVVKLIAKGLSVHEDEVRFYLEDSDFDVAKAYKQLLADHQFPG